MKPYEVEEFVRVWQAADSVDAIADTMGMTKMQINSMAVQCRKHGVPLKRFKRAQANYAALAKLAKSLAPKE